MDRLVDRLERLRRSVIEDRAWLGPVPAHLASFLSMESHRRSAVRAVLKSFEQVEDQLARGFRLVVNLTGKPTRAWHARDFADEMERPGVLDAAAAKSDVVRLRNRLAHDYPLDKQVQLDRLNDAIGSLPLLADTHRRLVAYIRNDLPGLIV